MIVIDDSAAPEKIQEHIRKDDQIELLGYIRRGMNGEVYFAKRKKLGDEIVLKYYLSKEGYDASEEAVILRNIDHPNILKIYDLRFVPPEYACFVSPRIKDGDLQHHIDVDPFSSKDALRIVGQILDGVTELHSVHKMVHRDLKPGNLLMDFKDNRVIIADLGAVKKITEADGFVSGSKATRVYLPPESLVHNKYYFQSDLYQVGIIMFQLLGGFFPINNQLEWLGKKERKEIDGIKNSIQRELKFYELIDKKIRKGSIANTSTLPDYLGGKFKRVLNQALHPNYKKRFQSSSEFLKAVHSLERDYPDYKKYDDHLLVSHDTGKQYKVYKDKKDKYVVEKRTEGKDWRKDKSHNGDFDSALRLTRNN